MALKQRPEPPHLMAVFDETVLKSIGKVGKNVRSLMGTRACQSDVRTADAIGVYTWRSKLSSFVRRKQPIEGVERGYLGS